jgi:hypothetical protein
VFRTLPAVATVYGYAHPAFDGYRPPMLDKPLQSFYVEVNSSAQDTRRAFGVLDDARSMRYLNVFMERLDIELRGVK